MLILVGFYLALRIPTFMYFIPELEYFRTAPTTGEWSEELQSRADRWVTLSIGRTAVIAGSYALAWMTYSSRNRSQRVEG